MIKKRLYFIGGIVLYAVAGLLTIYTVWAFIHCGDVISEAVSGGQITKSENMYEIISFYMNNSLQYFIYALLLAAVGLILHKKDGTEKVESGNVAVVATPTNSNGSEELDEWFEEKEEIPSETTQND